MFKGTSHLEMVWVENYRNWRKCSGMVGMIVVFFILVLSGSRIAEGAGHHQSLVGAWWTVIHSG